jgi:hypothetical protein
MRVKVARISAQFFNTDPGLGSGNQNLFDPGFGNRDKHLGSTLDTVTESFATP